MRKPKVNEPEVTGGILFEIEAHLAPLGWCYDDLYENSDLTQSLDVHLRNLQSEDIWLEQDECYLGTKYYYEEQIKADIRYRNHWRIAQPDAKASKDYRNADRRSKLALKNLTSVRNKRLEINESLEELRIVIAGMKNANRSQSRLPQAYNEETFLP